MLKAEFSLGSHASKYLGYEPGVRCLIRGDAYTQPLSIATSPVRFFRYSVPSTVFQDIVGAKERVHQDRL